MGWVSIFSRARAWDEALVHGLDLNFSLAPALGISSSSLPAHLVAVAPVAPCCSLVEVRCLLRMYWRTADMAYLTARPILMKRGPVPLSRDLASQERETPSSLATCAGCSRGSMSFVFAGAIMARLLSCPSRWMHDAPEASAKRAFSYAKFPSW